MKSPSKSLVISPSRGPALKVRPPSFWSLPCGGYPQTPSQALPATVSSYPTLSYCKRGLRTTLQTSRQSLAGGLVDSESWLSPSKFWYGSRAFALPGVITPSRVRHVFLHPRFRRPLERGSMSGVTKRCNGIKRKGTQPPSSQRRPAFSVVGVKKYGEPRRGKGSRAIPKL